MSKRFICGPLGEFAEFVVGWVEEDVDRCVLIIFWVGKYPFDCLCECFDRTKNGVVSSLLCAFVESLSILLVLETDRYFSCSVEVIRGGMG